MSNNYEDYGYEEDYNSEKRAITRRRMLIIIFIIIAILIIIFLLKSCSGRRVEKPQVSEFDYEKVLLDAGKKYYENNSDLYPTVTGECTKIELQSLVDRGLVDPAKFDTCNKNTTYVQVCVLENGTKQFTPWLTCTGKNSDTEYESEKEGTLADVKTDSTLVSFMFMPQRLKQEGSGLGETEELWKDEIKYATYKTLGTTTYYRYRDMLYVWNIEIKKYYTTKGEANSTNEYYVSSPASGYTSKDSQTNLAYKWYTTSSVKAYACKDSNGKIYTCSSDDLKNKKQMRAADVAGLRPEGYTYKENGVNVYRMIPEKPTLYYECQNPKNGTKVYQRETQCGKGQNAAYTKEVSTFYSCIEAEDGYSSVLANKVDNANSKCTNWSAWIEKKCDTANKATCQYLTQYNWYKLEGDTTRKYYPSNATSASGEKTYYIDAPVSGAIKDESTKTTAYKWYKGTKAESSYSAVSPQSGATKTSKKKWSDWSDYSTKNPKISDGRERTIETRVKVKLQEIKAEVTEDSWENLAPDFVTEEEMIKIFNENKYEVQTLKDINNFGEIGYKIKMLVRNKKEVAK